MMITRMISCSYAFFTRRESLVYDAMQAWDVDFMLASRHERGTAKAM
jgi:hypothetical protein